MDERLQLVGHGFLCNVYEVSLGYADFTQEERRHNPNFTAPDGSPVVVKTKTALSEGWYNAFRTASAKLGDTFPAPANHELRTAREIKFLEDARKEGIAVPRVYIREEVANSDQYLFRHTPIYMQKIDATRLADYVAANISRPDEALKGIRAGARQVALAHRKGLVHGDIDGTNILMNSQATIIDPGISLNEKEVESKPEVAKARDIYGLVASLPTFPNLESGLLAQAVHEALDSYTQASSDGAGILSKFTDRAIDGRSIQTLRKLSWPNPVAYWAAKKEFQKDVVPVVEQWLKR